MKVVNFSVIERPPSSQVLGYRTHSGSQLRRPLGPGEWNGLAELYETHHQSLLRAVESELARTGCVLIVDCHSFPSRPLPCDQDQSVPRPHFCIGTDPFHTPPSLARATESELERMGYSVGVNRPYEGTIVPMAFWQKDRRVISMMIEVNRSLYMDEATGRKTAAFASVAQQMNRLLCSVSKFQELAVARAKRA